MDMMKGIAIILVVVGHCIQYGSGIQVLEERSFFDNTLFKFIYSFHMPLFALISGYLFYFSSCHRAFYQIVKRRIEGLCIPAVAWAVIMLGLKFVSSVIFDDPYIQTLKGGIVYSFTGIWFLWAIFWNSLVILFVKNFLGDRISVYVIILVLLILLPSIYNLSTIGYLYPYIIFGYLANKYSLVQHLQKVPKRYIVLVLVVTVLLYSYMLCDFKVEYYIYTTGISIFHKDFTSQLWIDLYRWLIGFMGCGIILYLSKFITQQRVLSILSLLGVYSLGIYVISCPLNLYIQKYLTTNFSLNYFSITLQSVIILVMSVVIAKLIQKNRLLNKFLLGGR